MESARPPDKCVLRRSASGGRIGSACAARHTPTLNELVGPTQFTLTHQTRQDCPVCVVSGVSVWIRQLLLDFKFSVSDSLELSVIQFTPPKRRGTDQTVLSCLAWRCESTLREAKAIFVSANKYTAHDFVPTMLAYPVRRLTRHPRTSVTAQACAFCARFSFFSIPY